MVAFLSKKSIIGTILFSFLWGNILSNDRNSSGAGIERKQLRDYFDYPAGTGMYSANYDTARIILLNIIQKSETAGYWDICLNALAELAAVSDQNYRSQVQKDAVEKGERILRLQSSVLDSLDPDYSIRANMNMMIGSYYYKDGEFNKAVVVLQSLIQKLRKTKGARKKDIFGAYAYLADLYMKMGLYEKVYESYIIAGQFLPEETEDYLLYSYILDLYLGSYYYRMKNFVLAKSYYVRALKKIRNKPMNGDWKLYLIPNYDILALIYQSLDQRDSALICLQKSLSLQSPKDASIMETYEYYGDCLLNFKDFKGALVYFEKIRSYQDKNGNYTPYQRASILSKIGQSYQGQKKYNEALKSYQRAFAIIYRDSSYLSTGNYSVNPDFTSIQPDKTIIRLLIFKSNALYEVAKLSKNKQELLLQAMSTYRLATLVIDEFRQRIGTDDFKEFFVTDVRNMYQNAIKASYLYYRIAPDDSIVDFAFYFMEKSKNQVLLDAIRENAAMKYGNIPARLISEENKFKNKIVMLQNRLYNLKFKNADPGLISNCQYEYVRMQSSYGDFLQRLETTYPDYYRLKFGYRVPAMHEIKKILKGQLLIEYMIGDNFIGVISFNQEKSFFKLFPLSGVFKENLTVLLRDLGNEDGENRYSQETFQRFVHAAGALYSVLLRPALKGFKEPGRLIIIPDERLCFLPFDVLIDKIPRNLNQVNYENLDYVLRQFVIHYEFSSELFVEHTRTPDKKINRDSYLGFAPDYVQKEGLKKVRVLGKNNSSYLTPLAFNRQEIEEAASIFNGRAYIGKSANANAFRGNRLSSKIIHIAAHTVLNDSIPELSGIFFSNDPEEGVKENETYNDVIYVNEIYNLNINSSLAILSACGTGKGKLLKGEGLISIGRAFQYAGCPGMIMSLWKITDRSAAEIMKVFCRNIKRGRNVDLALRDAKIDFLNHAGAYKSHPFYWSAFVLIGKDRPLFHRNYIVPAMLFVLIIAVGGLIYFKKKKRH
jgi:CHAT domain-containing protein/tetratricopeptide (TPR) repeat protein